MAAPTRTPDQILAHREQIAAQVLRGEYQVEIAAALGISQQQVSDDLKAIRRVAGVRRARLRRAQGGAGEDRRGGARVLAGVGNAPKGQRNIGAGGRRGRSADAQNRIKKVVMRKEGRADNPAFWRCADVYRAALRYSGRRRAQSGL